MNYEECTEWEPDHVTVWQSCGHEMFGKSVPVVA